MDPELESRATGGEGPGIEPSEKPDPTVITALGFAIAGFMPVSWAAKVMGYGYFGPIAWPAILSMVGVLFAVIALLRSIDLQDTRLRTLALVAMGLGVVRLFILPLF